VNITPRYVGSADILSAELHNIASGKYPWYIALHLFLLQGIVPDSVLKYSAITILNPAWSLSLEWQFYLVAPFMIALCKRSHWGTVAAVACAGYIAFSSGFFGTYIFQSVLPLSGPYFLIGIVTRFAIDRLPRLNAYPAAAVISIGILLVELGGIFFVPCAVWLALIAYLKCSEAAFERSTIALRVLRLALDSNLARAAGARSYSVYIFHWIVVSFQLYVIAHVMGLSSWKMFAALTIGSILLTVAGSELIYQHVEKRGIRLGKQLSGEAAPLGATA